MVKLISEKVKKIFEAMSLKEKIGQVVICGFYGYELSNEIEELITSYHLGSVILFTRNVKSASQLKSLTHNLQRISNIPLLIAIDQEGGVVTRLRNEFTIFPSNMAVAATKNPENAYQMGLIMAKEMRAVGINWNLAPVVDVNDLPQNPGIGVRSYSDDSKIVSEYASLFIKGLHDGKVAACAKHFPGKGHSAKDAHLEMPVVERKREELEDVELRPFKRLVRSGVDAVMPSHVYYTALCESENIPATLSRNIMTGILRENMNFEGVCVTDDMEMGGITNSLKGNEAAWRALKAGADIVMMCHTFEEQIKTFKKVEEKVKSGDLPSSRIDEAVIRVLNLKEKLGLLDGTFEIKHEIGSKESKEFAMKLASDSLTLCKNEDGLIGNKLKEPILILFPQSTTLTMAEEKKEINVEMERIFKSQGLKVKTVFYPLKPTQEEIKDLLKKIEGFNGTLILNTINAHLDERARKMVKEIVKMMGKNTVLVALRNPYDCFINGVRNAVATYWDGNASQRAFAQALITGDKLKGKLPLSKSEEFS